MSALIQNPQIVPSETSAADEENIQHIAAGLSNPSPFLPKSFDFSDSSVNPLSFFLSPANPQGPTGFPFNLTSFVSTPTTPSNIMLGLTTPQPLEPVKPVAPVVAAATTPVKVDAKTEPVEASQHAAPHTTHDDSASGHSEEESHDPDDADVVPESDDDEDDDTSFVSKPRQRKRKPARAVGTHVKCFADLTDDEIAFMDFKELTRLMSAAGLSRQAIADTKARRRRLKNRQSARLCSNKKRELCNELLTDKDKLMEQLQTLQEAYNKLQRENDTLRAQLGHPVKRSRHSE